MPNDEFQKRLQRIQKTSEPSPLLESDTVETAPRVASKSQAAPTPASVNKILGRAIAVCAVAAVAIIALFGMDSFRSGGDDTAEAAPPKPIVRRMN